MTKSSCKNQSELPIVLDKKTILFLTLQMRHAELNSTVTLKTITITVKMRFKIRVRI